MTDENKNEIKKENVGCFCKSEWFKKFLTKALAVFVGTYCALSLFAALHRPPMPPCPFANGHMKRPCHHKMHHYKNFDKQRADYHRKMEKRHFDNYERSDKKPVNIEK